MKDLIKTLVKETNKRKLTYDQLKYLFRQVRKNCKIDPEIKAHKLYELATTEELKKYYGCIESPLHRLIFKTLEGTGLRVNELCNLEIKHLDFPNNTILMKNGKGHKDRVIVFGNKLKETLSVYLLGRKNRYLFESNRGTRYSTRMIQILCKRYKELSGLSKKFTVHTFRHIWNTRLAENNILKEHRAMLAGHSNDKTQDIYTHLGVAGIKNRLIEILDSGV